MKTSICRMTPAEWSHILNYFLDANIYQSWGYTSARWGDSNIFYYVLEDSLGIKAAALVRSIRIPFLRAGLAYISMGPMWRSKDQPADSNFFSLAMAGLRKELVEKRNLHLRIRPNVKVGEFEDIENILSLANFEHRPATRPYQSLLIDLNLSEEELMASFHGKWRNCLTKGLKNDCKVLIGDGLDLFDSFLTLHSEMRSRKEFVERMDLKSLRKAQSSKDESNKLIIFLAESSEKPVAATVISWMGDTAIYLLGASCPEGRNLNASYVLQWNVIRNLKNWGCRWYDLGGINTQGRSGILRFKERLAGKRGIPIQLIGELEANGGLLSRGLTHCIDLALKASR